MTDAELKTVYDTFTDAWRLYRDFADIGESDDYWKALIKAAKDFSAKHGKTKLSVDLSLTVLRELERRGQRKATENDWKGGLGRDSRATTGNIASGEAKEQAS